MADKFAIISDLNGLCLNVENGSKEDGARLITCAYQNAAHQQFVFYCNGVIESVNSGKVLTVEGEAAQGNIIVQSQSSEAANQLWKIHTDGSIRLVGSNLCFDIHDSNKDSGTSVIAWPHNGGANQCWRLVNHFD